MTDAPARLPPRRWHLDLPDLSGQRAVVTGGSDGVGAEVARALASAGAEVVMPVRNRIKGRAVIARIRAETPEALVSLRDVDLESFASVRDFTQRLRAERTPISMLVINAGVVMLGDRERYVTGDGNERHLQTNALSHAAMVSGLLPLLRAGHARMAVQCSLAAQHGRFVWDDPQSVRDYRPLRAYTASKILLGTFALEFARRSARNDWAIRTVLCHPGVSLTNIAPDAARERPGAASRMAASLMRRGIFGHHPGDAALPALAAVTDATLADRDFVVPSRLGETNGPPKVRAPYRALTSPVDGERAMNLLAWTAGVRLAGADQPAA
jgi:NAD(P)-dependent dehydrogenase (short-subunit alcohol dehydrogenase family)